MSRREQRPRREGAAGLDRRRFRFRRVVDREGGEEGYRQAKAEMERAKRLYDQLVAGESRR